MVHTIPRPPKMLVTGASGFLGAAVAMRGVKAGYDVSGIGRSDVSARLAGSKIPYEALDICNDAALESYLAITKPEIIVHSGWNGVAGKFKDQDVQYSNIVPTCRLIELGAKHGLTKFIGIGSQAEYGRYEGRIDETAPTNPNTLYGAAKLATCALAKQRAQELGIDFAWLRLFAIYGPGDNPHWLIPSLISALASKTSPAMTQGHQKCDYLYIDDAADAVLAIAGSNTANGIFNFSSGAAASVKEIALTLRDLIAPNLDLQFGTVPYGPTQVFHMEGDISKLTTATGWTPKVSLKDGLTRTVQEQWVSL